MLMHDIQLPDGSWVTSSMKTSSGLNQCPDNTCQWENVGPPAPAGLLSLVPFQIERCSVCGFMRGRYIGNPYPTVQVDGEACLIEHLLVIAMPRSKLSESSISSREFDELPCRFCHQPLLVDAENLKILRRGASLICISCAYHFCPNVHSGRDPDTGEALTVKQMVERPMIGNVAYEIKDVKES